MGGDGGEGGGEFESWVVVFFWGGERLGSGVCVFVCVCLVSKRGWDAGKGRDGREIGVLMCGWVDG